MVDFYEFLQISKPLVEPMNSGDIQKCWINHRTSSSAPPGRSKLPRNLWNAKLLLLGMCYRHIYPRFYEQKKSKTILLNQHFLDYETETKGYRGTDEILVWNDVKSNGYLFTVHEILSMIHVNLSHSDAVLETTFMICSILKSFHLPVNPYTGKSFSIQEMKQILGQLLYASVMTEGAITHIRHPEVFQYFCHMQRIHEECPSQEKRYETTKYLEKFFSQHSLVFKEKYKILTRPKTCENESKWTSSISRKDMQLFHILEHLSS